MEHWPVATGKARNGNINQYSNVARLLLRVGQGTVWADWGAKAHCPTNRQSIISRCTLLLLPPTTPA
ncbi:hypothetical protein E4U47_007538 [Claviceps purpurea]|nr:hypothetical protein E4U38_003364 [Claviceps purpurea]KAG6238779.1 hypothetical protein E4U23_008021 [Claviceps purpurea]KAG6263064.1 hypothetical protein E4U47_007538 [Claviceps purpurea]